MAKKEANFDLYINGLLNDSDISATAQGSSVLEINNALKTATKKQTGKAAVYPEYTAVVRDFVIVMEYKPDRSMLVYRNDDGSISLEITAVESYALNGALYYANHIVANTPYKRVFAFSNAGDGKHHICNRFSLTKAATKNFPKWKPLRTSRRTTLMNRAYCAWRRNAGKC